MNKVERPKASECKIHYKNEFELCYLRHQYLRRVDYNPTKEEMDPYKKITELLAKNTFFTYRHLFGSVGMESEDIVSIGQTHLVSFLGLFALEKTPDKMKVYIDKAISNNFGEPGPEDILNKNKANYTLFLKQRFEDLVRVCRLKVRNVKGSPSDLEFAVFYGKEAPPESLLSLLEDHESLGYRKMDIGTFKTMRKKANARNEDVFKFNDTYYVSIKREHKRLGLEDLSGAGLDPHDNFHNMSPERVLSEQQDVSFWENRRNEFNSYAPKRRARFIKSFISQFKDRKSYSEEVKTARRLLKSMENM